MAEENGETGPLLKGSVLPVTVEDNLNDMLVVCLKHGPKCYRGVLMDLDKRNLPYGIDFSLLDVAKNWLATDRLKSDVQKSTSFGQTTKPQTQLSAVCYRHTYSLDHKAMDSKLLPSPRRDLGRPLRDKNIRNMRLRPRQVLCTKCKEGIHDTACNTGSTNQIPSNQSVNTVITSAVPEKCVEAVTEKLEPRKRRACTEVMEELPKRLKPFGCNSLSKTSPVIKISFANPQGTGTVVEIPPKPNEPQQPSDVEEARDSLQLGSESPALNHEQYRKLRKALRKKAKLKEKSILDDEDIIQGDSCQNETDRIIFKKNKRAKHKRKHKHKTLLPEKTEEMSYNGKHGHDEDVKENTADIEPQITSEDSGDKAEVFPVGNPISNMSCFDSLNDLEKTFRKEDDTTSVIVLSPRRENPVAPSPSTKQYDSDNHALVIIEDDTQDLFQLSSVEPSDNGLGDSDNSLPASPTDYDLEDQENCEDPPGDIQDVDDNPSNFGPLMMRIQTKKVTKTLLEDGRIFRVGEVVWGKIHGFPWWPGRILSITESFKDSGVTITQMAHISWFASSTMSHMLCHELCPFLEDFKLRFNKRKKGTYKQAVKQASIVAHSNTNADLQDVNIEFLDD